MEKPGTKKKQNPKPSKKDRYERFQQTARDLGVDDDKSAKVFGRVFEKIVLARRKSSQRPAPAMAVTALDFPISPIASSGSGDFRALSQTFLIRSISPDVIIPCAPFEFKVMTLVDLPTPVAVSAENFASSSR